MRVDIYLTNLSKGNIAVGMTTIEPGKTEKILQKDFERKASYIDRMIKERRLSFGNAGKSTSADNSEDVVETTEDKNPPVATDTTPDANAGEDKTDPDSETEKTETQTSEADASDATEKEAVTEEKIEEAPVKEEPEVIETVAAPKRTKRTK